MLLNFCPIKVGNFRLYGSPRLAVEITKSGTPVSRTTVAIHMKEMDLKSKTRAKFKATTDSTHKEPLCENLLDRQFNPSSPTMTWISPIFQLWMDFCI